LDGRNTTQLPIVEFMRECTVVVTTVLFVAHKRDFYVLFKQWEWNTHNNIYMSTA
jgi:hypothetical protein